MPTQVNLIAACDQNQVIGYRDQLPWHLPEDLQYFHNVTRYHTVVMGHRTWLSLSGPLKDRHNVVVTRQNRSLRHAQVYHSWTAVEAALAHLDCFFVIGGGQLYTLALPYASCVYLTRIQAAFTGDCYFPVLEEHIWQEVHRVKGVAKHFAHAFDYLQYHRRVPAGPELHG